MPSPHLACDLKVVEG
ncbi:hypothetical protein STIAU_4555, partial [Stigmatella aurantiaca DW4/3-1]